MGWGLGVACSGPGPPRSGTAGDLPASVRKASGLHGAVTRGEFWLPVKTVSPESVSFSTRASLLPGTPSSLDWECPSRVWKSPLSRKMASQSPPLTTLLLDCHQGPPQWCEWWEMAMSTQGHLDAQHAGKGQGVAAVPAVPKGPGRGKSGNGGRAASVPAGHCKGRLVGARPKPGRDGVTDCCEVGPGTAQDGAHVRASGAL